MPSFGVSVAIEDDAIVFGADFADELGDLGFEFAVGGFEAGSDIVEGFGEDGIEDGDGHGDGLVGPDSAEFKLVSRESKGAGAVAIARVFGEAWEGIDAKAESSALFATGGFACFDLLEDLGELFAKEDRDNGGRGFVCAEAVVVSGACDNGTQESGVFAAGADDSGAKDEKADVEVGVVAGFEEVSDLSVAEGKVDVFS